MVRRVDGKATGGWLRDDRVARVLRLVAVLGSCLLVTATACVSQRVGNGPCGDGQRLGAEACDGTDLGGATCVSVGYAYGDLSCTSECALDLSGCHGECGDGIAQPDEMCDGADLGGVTCEDLGYEGGELFCTERCQRSEWGCHRCGNGEVDPREQCDGDDVGGVTCEYLSGGVMGGDVRCGDDCRLDTSGCSPPTTCGNGVKEAGEQCDGEDLGLATCALVFPELYGSGTLACQENCLFDTAACVLALPCGNGVAEPEYGEDCDRRDLAGATCESLGFTWGELFCDEGCNFDTLWCGPPAFCGNGVRDPPEECDGVDVGTASCQGFGFVGGSVGCTGECRFDLSLCNHCGNGLREGDEECDGADTGELSCEDLGFYAGLPLCSPDCTLDVGPCEPFGRCGDGVLQGSQGEECDGDDLGGQSCEALGFYGGVPGCTEDCRFEASPCEPFGWCGDGVRQTFGGEECDGNDLGGQTCEGLGFPQGVLRCDGSCEVTTTTCALCGDGRCQAGEPVSCPQDCILARVGTGSDHACGIWPDGTVWCWGRGNGWQLGDGLTYPRDAYSASPRQVLLSGDAGVLTDAVSLALGAHHGCALRSDSTVHCWGDGRCRALGNGSSYGSSTAVQVLGEGGTGVLSGALGISAFGGREGFHWPGRHTCVLLADSRVICWGCNGSGQVGAGDLAMERDPSFVVGPGGIGHLEEIVSISAGATHSCALSAHGRVYCWGDSVGLFSAVPVEVTSLQGVRSISAGYDGTCVTLEDGSVWCWGYPFGGPTPVKVESIPAARSVHLGDRRNCVIGFDEALWCWGSNNGFGAVGVGLWYAVSAPAPVLQGARWVSHGYYTSCAALGSGELLCWGRNNYGQVGMGTDLIVRSPLAVMDSLAVRQVDTMSEHTCLAAEDGTAWCWGTNLYERLGLGLDGYGTKSASPMQVVGMGSIGHLQEVLEVCAGQHHSCAALVDGTAVCWGRNDYGALGDGGFTSSSFPVSVVGEGGVGLLTEVEKIDCGEHFTCARRSDGTLWCWGWNANYALGSVTAYPYHEPIPAPVMSPEGVGDLDEVAGFALGGRHGCARRLDGSLWCWGRTAYGTLGIGDYTVTSCATPMQVVGPNGVGYLEDVTEVAAAPDHTCAVAGGGALFCWGKRYGATEQDLEPVMIHGGPVERIALGPTRACFGDGIWQGSLCWGLVLNETGSSINHAEPVQVDWSGAVEALSVGTYHTCAIREDLSLWCYGVNTHAAVGAEQWYHQARPVPVVGF